MDERSRLGNTLTAPPAADSSSFLEAFCTQKPVNINRQVDRKQVAHDAQCSSRVKRQIEILPTWVSIANETGRYKAQRRHHGTSTSLTFSSLLPAVRLCLLCTRKPAVSAAAAATATVNTSTPAGTLTISSAAFLILRKQCEWGQA